MALDFFFSQKQTKYTHCSERLNFCFSKNLRYLLLKYLHVVFHLKKTLLLIIKMIFHSPFPVSLTFFLVNLRSTDSSNIFHVPCKVLLLSSLTYSILLSNTGSWGSRPMNAVLVRWERKLPWFCSKQAIKKW